MTFKLIVSSQLLIVVNTKLLSVANSRVVLEVFSFVTNTPAQHIPQFDVKEVKIIARNNAPEIWAGIANQPREHMNKLNVFKSHGPENYIIE